MTTETSEASITHRLDEPLGLAAQESRRALVDNILNSRGRLSFGELISVEYIGVNRPRLVY